MSRSRKKTGKARKAASKNLKTAKAAHSTGSSKAGKATQKPQKNAQQRTAAVSHKPQNTTKRPGQKAHASQTAQPARASQPSRASQAAQLPRNSKQTQPARNPKQTQPARNPNQAKPARSQKHANRHVLPFVAVLVASILSAAIMAFGSPLLWSVPDAPSAQVAPGSAQAALPDGVDPLGAYRAVSQSTDNGRAHNIAEAARALNGTMIKPGDTLSLNDLLGDTALQSNYVDAPVVSGSSIAVERGGGVCQVATALYIAALKSNLEIVERHPHTVACDYAPIGLDATLAYGSKDLKVKNTGAEPVYIAVTAQGQAVEVAIGGRALAAGASIDALSKVIETVTVPASEAPEEFDLADVDPDEMVSLYTAESYKVKYVDGVMRDQELLATDTYLVPSGS